MPQSRLRRYFRHGLLPQLMAFEACVRLGSVTRAAEELSLAQPTISCMLRKLSDTMGGPVTVIRERRVVASALGLELQDLVRDLLHAFERFEMRGDNARTRYDRLAAPEPDETPPWPSSSPSRNPSRWRQRASQCPRARRRPGRTDGRS
jgi:DNA-binding transcriptional LysR family regulator